MRLQTLRGRIRGLVDDLEATFATDDYLNPLVNQVYEDVYNSMISTTSEFEEAVVDIPNVLAGTTSLGDLEINGETLDLLLQPRHIDWKLAGADPTLYLPANGPLDKLPDVIPSPMLVAWQWRQLDVKLVPFSTPLDLRVTGEFLFPILEQDNDRILVAKNIGAAMAYGVGELIGIGRGNAMWVQKYGEKKQDALDDIAQASTRAEQAKTRRVARVSRRQYTGSIQTQVV